MISKEFLLDCSNGWSLWPSRYRWISPSSRPSRIASSTVSRSDQLQAPPIQSSVLLLFPIQFKVCLNYMDFPATWFLWRPNQLLLCSVEFMHKRELYTLLYCLGCFGMFRFCVSTSMMSFHLSMWPMMFIFPGGRLPFTSALFLGSVETSNINGADLWFYNNVAPRPLTPEEVTRSDPQMIPLVMVQKSGDHHLGCRKPL